MLRYFSFTILFFLLQLLSCNDLTYNPDGKNENNITLPAWEIEIYLVNNPDTIEASGTTSINYSLSVRNAEFNRVEFYLNGISIAQTTNTQTYELNTMRFGNGIYNFTVSVWAYLGTGSMADLFGKEFVRNSTECIMVINN